jgi:hypothetical protein
MTKETGIEAEMAAVSRDITAWHKRQEKKRASLVKLAENARPPVTVIIKQKEPQLCGYWITIPKKDGQHTSMMVSASTDTSWTTLFDGSITTCPPGMTITVRAHSTLQPATSNNIRECRRFLKKLVSS